MNQPSQPSQSPTSALVNEPYEQGPTGLCLSCHQIKSLVSTHNNSSFNSSSSSSITMSKKKRPAPLQRQDVIVRWKNYFGAGDLEDWQRLCEDLGLGGGEFGSKTKCRTALKSINVNIWDFLDAVEVGNIPQMFLTKKELVKYTLKTGRIFPRDEAKDMGPVAALLKILR
ncbi:hypothetical protein GE21DRAFT_1745 [Neurospora crassa]|uniref:Uncharacterized protein n=1 Tax=Neurospora crassa (strain ATCC 24698 / 74-OR23-1A / CBS 708.71 / DSM 1257 / FGSC 987) TaxID=367110 RepID=Q7SGH6_NEUCR|nr:hypothetical protein NCU00946 [Neurospora crassa OR74A]EAA35903.2 hypothetical protein NCU00946 [Neurospora crassa OR74A]KHE81777.1 hypothetical protein GE21DRAFT_1745 [Neurospora crassa]|eukprot:XP_965139.2 hypothetical protein NCU00946 [Neurospora crassa OR74A]